MDTPPPKEPRHFWASASAAKVIRDALGNPDWKPKSGQEAWETLRDEIVALNSKGRFKPFNAPKQVVNGRETYLLIDGQPLPEKEDWLAMKPELCRRLAIVARLLQLFRRRLLTRLDKHKGMSPEKLAERLRDPRTRTFFDLACSLGSLDTPMGMNALEKVGREGVTWTLPGGIEQCYRDRDCGFEPMVLATRYALKILGKKPATSAATRHPIKKRKVRVTVLRAVRYKLKARNVPAITVGGKYGILFGLLYDAYESKGKGHGGWVPYETCADHIYAVTDDRSQLPSEQLQPTKSAPLSSTVGGKADDRLKKLKSELEGKLRTAFGFATENPEHGWIETAKGEGYRLNQDIVIWDRSRKRTASRKVEPEQ